MPQAAAPLQASSVQMRAVPVAPARVPPVRPGRTGGVLQPSLARPLQRSEATSSSLISKRTEPPLTVTTESGRVMLNPDAMLPEVEVERVPVINEFHQWWQGQRDDPYNKASPNSLPPLPLGLKRRERNEFMKKNDNVYPTVKLFMGDTVHHFTTREGAIGIEGTQMMYPSVVAGIQTTHYGRGVYFTAPRPLGDLTHGDVTRAIYTADNAENRRRSEFLATVDVRDRVVLEHRLRGKAPVLMHPTTEPIDVLGRMSMARTASLVKPDSPPSNSSNSSAPRKARPRKPVLPPGFVPKVTDWELAFKDYETAQWADPKTYAHMSFSQFILQYSQDL